MGGEGRLLLGRDDGRDSKLLLLSAGRNARREERGQRVIRLQQARARAVMRVQLGQPVMVILLMVHRLLMRMRRMGRVLLSVRGVLLLLLLKLLLLLLLLLDKVGIKRGRPHAESGLLLGVGRGIDGKVTGVLAVLGGETLGQQRGAVGSRRWNLAL